ncbi:unnamed protein product [Aureobasidium vineae]|uniref:Uncharacterized protein n=1 Tax=Aureobasidium vineae TaxID=2773715 RepID=A0A9N8JB99_9PEZI|nr:unnamed protein product [Aureobasidium vineae]
MFYLDIVTEVEESLLGSKDQIPSMVKTKESTKFERTALSQTLERILELIPSFGKSKSNSDLESAAARTRKTVELKKDQLHGESSIRNQHGTILLQEEDVRRWTMAADMFRTTRHGDKPKDSLVRRSRNWPSMDIQPGNLPWTLLIALNVSSIMYGGLHALAWNADFVNTVQQKLWRLASLFVMTFVPASTFVLLIENLLTVGGEYKFEILTKVNKFMYYLQIWQISFGLSLLAYVWARIFLVVESFISLGHSLAGVYDLPVWSVYVPHIT